MILIDKPYVSELLVNTIKNNRYPVVETSIARVLAPNINGEFVPTNEGISLYNQHPLLYVNSENTIGWINAHLGHTSLPAQVNIFKDKGNFRDMLHKLYPDFRYKKLHFEALNSYNPEAFGFPFILKPAVGFFSMGIYIIENIEDWHAATNSLARELQQISGVYPQEVMNSGHFLLEQLIPGDEYAVDVYFNQHGEPVILNIYEHVFSDKKDVNDRAYFTSQQVIENTHDIFLEKLRYIGSETNIKQFPMHIEFRITPRGEAIPIEANPLRFAGWCMTDITHYAWGINPYEYFFNQQKPDWEAVFRGKSNKQYNVIIADIPRQIDLNTIDYVDYSKFEADFSHLLHIHRTNYREYPVFAFAFSETTKSDQKELNHFLHSDLTEYLVLKE